MMDLHTLRAVNAEIAQEAEARKDEPKVLTLDQIIRAKDGDLAAVKLSNLGPYLPEGWQRVSLEHFNEQESHGVYMADNDGYGAYFVDKSGFGTDDEPALSLRQFFNHLRPGYGYAVIEEGQFQVKVGVFRPVGTGRNSCCQFHL